MESFRSLLKYIFGNGGCLGSSTIDVDIFCQSPTCLKQGLCVCIFALQFSEKSLVIFVGDKWCDLQLIYANNGGGETDLDEEFFNYQSVYICVVLRQFVALRTLYYIMQFHDLKSFHS